MHTFHTQPTSAFAEIEEGKITIDRKFDGTLHLNTAGKPEEGLSNGIGPYLLSLRVTSEEVSINIPLNDSGAKQLYEQLQKLDEMTSIFEEESADASISE